MSQVTPALVEPEGSKEMAAALSMLADLSQAFTQSIDIEQTLREAVTRIAEHMQGQAASLFLRELSTGDCVCRASAGPVDVVGLRLKQGQGIVGRAIAENRAQLVRDVQQDPDFIGNQVANFIPRTMICAPLSTAMGAIGALQVINKRDGARFAQHDVDVLRVLAVPTALALSNARLAQDLLEQNRIRREFELARQMQKTLLPKRRRNYPVNAINRPAREISGDFYDFFDLPDGRIAFTIGDVSGKGMDAALLMVRASSLLRFLGKDGVPPARWLKRANDELCETVRLGMFVCALVGYYQPDTGTVELASAGFPPALLRAPDGRTRSINAHGPPLGIVSGVDFEFERLCLAGRSLYCFSDGMTDARESGGGMLGLDGVQALIERVSGLPPGARLRGLLMQLRHRKLPDDTTVLLVSDEDAPPRLLAATGCLSNPENLKNLRELVRGTCKSLGLAEQASRQLVLAVEEAVTNVIRHGYSGALDGKLELELWLVGAELQVLLRDYAKPVPADCIKPRDLSECRPGGLGINLIDMSFDRWGFEIPTEGNGNLLRMSKDLIALEAAG